MRPLPFYDRLPGDRWPVVKGVVYGVAVCFILVRVGHLLDLLP